MSGRVKTRNDKQYQMKKREILKGFSEMIAEFGLENISIAKLAKHLEIPPSLIIYYFQNRDILIDEMVSYVLERCLEMSYPGIDKEINDPSRQLEAYLDTLFDPSQSPEEAKSESKVFFTCRNLALRDEATKLKFQSYQKKILFLMEEDLNYFLRQGIISTPDVGEAAILLYSLLNGLDDFSDFIIEKEMSQIAAESSKRLYKSYLGIKAQK